MSATASRNALEKCREAAVSTAWAQWSVLGGQVGGQFRAPTAVVDPEATILFSCAMRDAEPRLWDLIAGFVAEGSALLSVQRMRNLSANYPRSVGAILAEVAVVATLDGKDARWRPLAEHASPRSYRQGKVYRPTARVAEPPALVLRLRLGFGVHARTDALVFLLATAPSSATAREVAEATGYGSTPVRRALEAMATARVIGTEGSRPERYHAYGDRWEALLDHGYHAAAWRYWQSVFVFLANAFEWAGSERAKGLSPYLKSSQARELVMAHRPAFARNRIPVPEPSDYRGEEYLEGFDRTLDAVTVWLEENT